MKSKNKSFLTLAICGALAIVGAVIGLTSAWFTSSVSVSGTIKTGTLKVKIGSPTSISVTGAVPGDTVISAIKIQNNGSDINCYLRVQIVTSGTGVALTIGSASTGWTKDGTNNVWYYGSSTTSLTEVTPAILNNSLTLTSISIASSVGNTAMAQTVTVTIYADAVQSKNTSASTATAFDAIIARH